MQCHEAEPLIPSYLDGELSEAQAAPLRRHLLDCQPCRAGAQAGKNLTRWFSAGAAVAAPQGFAARVARRAFAGDTGEPEVELVPASAAAIGLRHGAPGGAEAVRAARADVREDRILRFVLQVTAAAALVVIALSVALRSLNRPTGTSLRAADGRNEISVEQALERLDQLNLEEAQGKPVPASNGAGTGTVEIRKP